LTDERLKIAVFIDFDNIEIGVKTTLGATFDVGTILEAIKERGEVVTKVAYGDWKRAGEHSRMLTQHAIRMVQRNVTPGGDKNGADINLALDALEMALTHEHINAFVIVGGDSDFISLVEKLKQYDKKVLVVGGRAFTSIILQRNCHEFIAYENLMPQGPGRRAQERARPAGQSASAGQAPLADAFPLVRRALKVLSEREVTPQLGLFKSTLLQLDSTFSEREYGAGSFRDFVEKLAESGLVTLRQSGRSILVDLKESAEGEAAVPTPTDGRGPRHGRTGAPHFEERRAAVSPEPVESAPPATTAPAGGQASQVGGGQVAQVAAGQAPAGPAPTGLPADGVHAVQRIFEAIATPPRWPMYVRNVKQIMRSMEPGFDERRYGFAGILDLLRACGRENVLRLERDRQGVLRVFPGSALRPASAHAGMAAAGVAPVAEPVESATVQVDEGDQAAAVAAEGTVSLPVAPEPEPVEAVAVQSGATIEAKAVEESGESKLEPPAAKGRRRRAPAKPVARKTVAARKPRPAAPRARAAKKNSD
jgi:uncharacterized LabA/DUF88 family protein